MKKIIEDISQINPLFLTDGYKPSHREQYPSGTKMIYSNETPRSNKFSPWANEVVVFGIQSAIRHMEYLFRVNFFKQPKSIAIEWISDEFNVYYGKEFNVEPFEKLWSLGYLPLLIKTLPEGTSCPIGVPFMTIRNTFEDDHEEFFWLTNYLETVLSMWTWKAIDSATIALDYRLALERGVAKTNPGFDVSFHAHDFSMRGMRGEWDITQSGMGFLTSLKGTDSIPAIIGARIYYNAEGMVGATVPATEHSVMSAGTADVNELETFRRLLLDNPTGIISIVTDTYDFFKALREYGTELKELIMSREGTVVFRPDSGNPADILCGVEIKSISDISNGTAMHVNAKIGTHFKYQDKIYRLDKNKDGVRLGIDLCIQEKMVTDVTNESYVKGAVEILDEIFGHTVSETGYKILDSHVGLIYGDAITREKRDEIISRLEAKGYATTASVLGVGSYSLGMRTRDNFGMAVKATAMVNSEGKLIPLFKDPVTDSGTKKSARGLLCVTGNSGEYKLQQDCTWEEENSGALTTIFKNGLFYNESTFTQIRERVEETVSMKMQEYAIANQ